METTYLEIWREMPKELDKERDGLYEEGNWGKRFYFLFWFYFYFIFIISPIKRKSHILSYSKDSPV